MSQIDFRLLQSAIVLADELNFSRAASREYGCYLENMFTLRCTI
jgi:hypothetical protein